MRLQAEIADLERQMHVPGQRSEAEHRRAMARIARCQAQRRRIVAATGGT